MGLQSRAGHLMPQKRHKKITFLSAKSMAQKGM
jgi:hypothetical protein